MLIKATNYVKLPTDMGVNGFPVMNWSHISMFFVPKVRLALASLQPAMD